MADEIHDLAWEYGAIVLDGYDVEFVGDIRAREMVALQTLQCFQSRDRIAPCERETGSSAKFSDQDACVDGKAVIGAI